MASKRGAISELNHDNWDEDYEPEDAGTFQRAPDEVIKKRVIKTARRRGVTGAASNDSGTKNVFSGFTGFGKTNTTSDQSAASPFAFLANLQKPTQNSTNGVPSSSSSSPLLLGKNINTPGSGNGDASMKDSNVSKDRLNSTPTDQSSNYYAKLKGLNESVSEWIKTHVDKNPFVVLTPIFKDYEKYLAEIENSKETSTLPTSEIKSQYTPSIIGNTGKSTTDGPSFISPNKSSLEDHSKKDTNDNNSATTTEKSQNIPTFSFTSNTSKLPTNPGSMFRFGTGTPFTFSNVSKSSGDKSETPATTTAEKPAEEEEDEPPKVEFTPVVEEGSVFQKRCKVFVKKNDQFADRGVGQLFLKPVEGSEKIQLIVRADTSLGNLLLNFILSNSIPMQRMGKNNVMLVSIPTPESKPPPVPILLRVKTAEEADELLKVLEKYRK